MKFCPSCGTKCQDTMKFCQNCGSALPEAPVAAAPEPENTYRSQPQNQYQNPYQNQNPYANQYQNASYVPTTMKTSNGFGIAALVLGLVGIFIGAAAIPMGVISMGLAILFLVPSMLAIVFGLAGIMKRRKDPNYGGYGLAIAGLVLGIIFFLIYLGLSVTAYNESRAYLGYYGYNDITDIFSDLF